MCGCSTRSVLNCSYIDSSSILGSKRVSDVIEFRNDKIISFRRNIDFSLHDGMGKDIGTVRKLVKIEGKSLKKYINGRYRVNRNSDGVSLSFVAKRFSNLKYIGIDINYGYDQVLNVYSELGFSCK